MKVLVTGADGFVGRALCSYLRTNGFDVVAAVRCIRDSRQNDVMRIAVGDIGPNTDWRAALQACDVVIHLAAHVHQMGAAARDADSQFDMVNVQGSENLGRQAATAGVRRFIFMSSVKVHGEFTVPGTAFVEHDTPAPQDAYARSKLAAERVLLQIAQSQRMELTIVRVPLVYGPGAKANFGSLLRAVSRGWPLPMGGIHNARSLVGLDNLVDAVALCVKHPAAANQTFLVSDGHDVSMRELVAAMAFAANKPVRLIAVPPALIRFGCVMLGRGDIALRLLGNLQVDISKLRTMLGWAPPVSLEAGLRKVYADGALP